MSDLIAWLRGCLDDDERRVIAYRDGHPGPCLNYEGQDPADHTPYDTCYLHIQTATATPYRDVVFGLADIAAKRAILDGIERRLDPREPDGGWESADAETDGTASSVVHLLAQPYADRDGWRGEWRT